MVSCKTLVDLGFYQILNSQFKMVIFPFVGVKDLLQGLFALNPTERMTLQEVRKHPW